MSVMPPTGFVHPSSMPSMARGRRCWFVLVTAFLLLGGSLHAQDTNTRTGSDESSEEFTLIKEGTRPLATLTLASAERFLSESEYIFEAAGNPEAFKIVEDFLKNTLNDLEGFNREKPFGVMAYLPVAFPPLPEFIAFVPVDSVEDATRLIEKAPVVIRKDDEKEGMYEVIGPNRTFPVMLQDGYAFMPLGNNPSADILDREIPDPARLVSSQAQQYDLSIVLDIESIPVASRTLLMGVITSGISTQLQQRDGEPEGSYLIRKTEGERALAALNTMINECQKMTFGLKVLPDERAVNMDMVIDALAGSQFLEEIFQSSSRPSIFIPLLDDDAAVSFSMSSTMAERDKVAYAEMINGVKMEVSRLIEEKKLGAVPDDNSPIGQALTAIQTTLSEGHIDTFAQFYKDSSGKLAIVGAAKVRDGDQMAAGVLDALTRLQGIEDLKEAGDLQVGAAEHQGITFHRLTFSEQPSEATAVFGKGIGLTIGVGSAAVWAVLGGEDAFPVLKSVMDEFEAARQSPEDRRTPPSFRMIVNVNQLVEWAKIAESASQADREAASAARDAATAAAATSAADKPPAAPSQNSERGDRGSRRRQEAQRRRDRAGEIFSQTMAEGDDRIEIDFRTTETGGRMRMRLEEGFVKILGRLLATAMMPEPPEENSDNPSAAPASAENSGAGQ